MKNNIPNFLLLLLASILITGYRHKDIKSQSPSELFPLLFQEVQQSHIYNDSKTFADCIPKATPASILKAYHFEKKQSGFSLNDFVSRNFTIPEELSDTFTPSINSTVEEHINLLWQVLRRQQDHADPYSSLIPLPYPYIVPGGRFREIYYWDSYFTMLGLKESGALELLKDMVDNFRYLILSYGFVPNGNRTYYLTRSQPPYFSLMVALLTEDTLTSSATAYLDALEKEYAFWMDKGSSKPEHLIVMPDGSLLNRYYDKGNYPREESWNEDLATAATSVKPQGIYRELRSGAESGWDYSSRWFSDTTNLVTIHVTDIIPVDLNCLLWNLENMLAGIYSKQHKTYAAKSMSHAAKQRKEALQKYCWDGYTGWFRDYDLKYKTTTVSMNLAGVYPMFFGLVRKGQADTMSKVIENQFLKPGGLVTTTRETGQQWDAPNGWAPLQWMVISGLNRYHKKDLSATIALRWCKLNTKTYYKTGKLLEKYNVVDTTLAGGGGEYHNQDGFGWTNGVLLKLLHQYPEADR